MRKTISTVVICIMFFIGSVNTLNEKTNRELVNWASQDWNRDDSFYSFENMTYHSSVDDNGSLSFVTDEIY